jgi:RNA polymerase sigma-70 factor (ECF subfamily)
MDAQETDEALMLRYAAGDAGAFEPLYARHKGPLYRYLLRHCSTQPVADELFQEVWTRVIQARGRYEVKARFTTWLYRLAHNCLVDHYRRRGRDNPVPSAGEDPVEQVPAPRHESPDGEAQHDQLVQRMTHLLETLPAEQRDVFLLREEAGLDLAAIAEVTGAGLEATKSRLRYALNKLRDGLKDWL